MAFAGVALLLPKCVAGSSWPLSDSLSFFLLGLIAGVVVGLTSIGSGGIVAPILVLLLRIPPSVAVSSAIVVGAATKALGTLIHYRKNTVDTTLVRHLLVGSIPGVAVGSLTFYWMRVAHFRASADTWIGRLLGMALLVFAVAVLLRETPWLRRLQVEEHHATRPRRAKIIGLLVGLLFGATSIGTGSLLVVLLSVFLRAAEVRVVGTAILYGFAVSLFGALFHVLAGNVSWQLVLLLSLGSIPGVILGSWLAVRTPRRALRPLSFQPQRARSRDA